MYLSGVHVHKLRDAVENRVGDFMIRSQMVSLTQLFSLENWQALTLLNAHVSLPFSLDGEVTMLPVSPYAGENPRTTKKERKTK